MLELGKDDRVILRILQNSKALQEFVKCRGKLNDLYECHSGQISYLLANIDNLKNFQEIGGSLETLYKNKLNPFRVNILLQNVSKITIFLEQGGTWDKLCNLSADTTVEYLLKYAEKIHLFKALGGNLEDLYTLPKERNAVEGCKVRVLLKQVERLECKEGSSIHGNFLLGPSIDLGVLSLFLENLPAFF